MSLESLGGLAIVLRAWTACYESKAPQMSARKFEALGNYRDGFHGSQDSDVRLYCLLEMANRLGKWIDANRIQGDAEAQEIVREFYDMALEYADFSKLQPSDRTAELVSVFNRAKHFAGSVN